MGRRQIHPIQEFNGIRYYRKPPGYYRADKGDYMHRDVWRFHNGPIPAGYDVHHKDEDRGHNWIENLEALPGPEHASLHGKLRALADPEGARAHMAEIRPLASVWHGSAEGREWHREHGKAVAASLEVQQFTCVRCGADYQAKRGAPKRGYCSPACQSAARRASGVDDEARVCIQCGADFTVNRYEKTVTCGRSCAGALRRSHRDQGL